MRAPRRYTFDTLFFEATRACNMACSMCMASSNEPELVRRSRKRELTTDEIERHILSTAREIGIRTITWSGGEYILRPDAVELVRRATKHGYCSTVCSNGLRMTREKLEQLNEASQDTLVVAVGINSIEDENAWTRDAHCDLALVVLKLCLELGIRRHVVVNVGSHNLETLDRTLQWLADKGIPYNRSPYTARGSDRKHWDGLRVTLLDEVCCGNVREKSFQQIIDDSPAFQQVLDRNLLKGKCGRCRYKFTCGGCRAMAYFEHGDLMAEDPTCFFEPIDESTSPSTRSRPTGYSSATPS